MYLVGEGRGRERKGGSKRRGGARRAAQSGQLARTWFSTFLVPNVFMKIWSASVHGYIYSQSDRCSEASPYKDSAKEVHVGMVV